MGDEKEKTILSADEAKQLSDATLVNITDRKCWDEFIEAYTNECRECANIEAHIEVAKKYGFTVIR